MPIKPFLLVGLAFALVTVRSLPAQQHPDFTGSWRQQNDRCEPKPQGPLIYTTQVDQHGSTLVINITSNRGIGPRTLSMTYEIGGPEAVYKGLDGDENHTHVYWKGETLVFDTVELERGSKLPNKEVWTLLDNGKLLKRVKQQTGKNEPGEPATRLYIAEKQ